MELSLKAAIFTRHAEEQLVWRGISKEAVIETLTSPDSIEEATPERLVIQKLFSEAQKVYIIRVFVDVDRNPNEIVTAYKTSKIDKYRRLQ